MTENQVRYLKMLVEIHFLLFRLSV